MHRDDLHVRGIRFGLTKSEKDKLREHVELPMFKVGQEEHTPAEDVVG